MTLALGLRLTFRDVERLDARTMRHRYISAIFRIAKFVSETKVGSHIALSLDDLAMSLSDLDFGIVDPVLAPPRIDNRTPNSAFIWSGRARLVSAYELLRASGVKPGGAIKRIREDGNAFDPLLERSSVKVRADLEKSLKSWRKAFRAFPVGIESEGFPTAVA